MSPASDIGMIIILAGMWKAFQVKVAHSGGFENV